MYGRGAFRVLYVCMFVPGNEERRDRDSFLQHICEENLISFTYSVGLTCLMEYIN